MEVDEHQDGHFADDVGSRHLPHDLRLGLPLYQQVMPDCCGEAVEDFAGVPAAVLVCRRNDQRSGSPSQDAKPSRMASRSARRPAILSLRSARCMGRSQELRPLDRREP